MKIKNKLILTLSFTLMILLTVEVILKNILDIAK